MNVHWKVFQFYPIQNIFRVRYWTDVCEEGIFKNLPLPFDLTGEAYWKGDRLEEYMKYNAPVLELKQLEYLQSIKDAENV